MKLLNVVGAYINMCDQRAAMLDPPLYWFSLFECVGVISTDKMEMSETSGFVASK